MSCDECNGTGRVNLGIRSDPEYHTCPKCGGKPIRNSNTGSES